MSTLVDRHIFFPFYLLTSTRNFLLFHFEVNYFFISYVFITSRCCWKCFRLGNLRKYIKLPLSIMDDLSQRRLNSFKLGGNMFQFFLNENKGYYTDIHPSIQPKPRQKIYRKMRKAKVIIKRPMDQISCTKSRLPETKNIKPHPGNLKQI